MRKHILAAMTALLGLCVASAASAGSFSFTETGNYNDYLALGPFIPAGAYKVMWTSTFPLDPDPVSLTLSDRYI